MTWSIWTCVSWETCKKLRVLTFCKSCFAGTYVRFSDLWLCHNNAEYYSAIWKRALLDFCVKSKEKNKVVWKLYLLTCTRSQNGMSNSSCLIEKMFLKMGINHFELWSLCWNHKWRCICLDTTQDKKFKNSFFCCGFYDNIPGGIFYLASSKPCFQSTALYPQKMNLSWEKRLKAIRRIWFTIFHMQNGQQKPGKMSWVDILLHKSSLQITLCVT